MKMIRLVLLLMSAFFSCVSARASMIDMVTIDNAGNAPDTRYNSIAVGSVGYDYQIGKFEVTARQYTEFLNAVAKEDLNGVYSFSTGIQRNGSSPNFSYSVNGDLADRPVHDVSFWDAARFANWLHNNQPSGAQGPGTTEDGAYINIGNQTTFARQPGAKFFIPTEDEWYKAAYHNRAAGLAASYFDYPTGTNAVPGRDMNETTNAGNNANYFLSGHLIGAPYYRTVAGEFELSDSPYGTFDQGGNVYEWNETKVANSSRGVRGGSFDLDSSNLHASLRVTDLAPTGEYSNVGFRVASLVPEPGSITLFLACLFMFMLTRDKR